MYASARPASAALTTVVVAATPGPPPASPWTRQELLDRAFGDLVTYAQTVGPGFDPVAAVTPHADSFFS